MKLSDQVVAALKALHPDARKEIRRALGDLDSGHRRDIKRLSKPLDGFWRLRVGKYRVIYRIDPQSKEVFAEFLDSRDLIYEHFSPPSRSPEGPA